METLPKDKKIVLFDGVCNLCDSSVQFIIKQDKNDVFRFVALQSELGQSILKHIGIGSQLNNVSIVLYEPGIAYYIKSEAAFKIATSFTTNYKHLSILSIFPKFITDFGYDYIAKNRYKWYGKKEECMIPSSELKAKFL